MKFNACSCVTPLFPSEDEIEPEEEVQNSLAWLRTAFGDKAPCKTTIYNLFVEFKSGCVNLSDEFRDGRPTIVVNNKKIDGRFKKGASHLVRVIVTGDETWIYCYEPKIKQQLIIWVYRDEPKPTKEAQTPRRALASRWTCDSIEARVEVKSAICDYCKRDLHLNDPLTSVQPATSHGPSDILVIRAESQKRR
ncbi:hypothetical protein EVAR_22755_1 [Eumeta japonica]|uniref:Uncharacterized protein n=1 Tax=Eumeta variegata TaxID=151549 RepID=A0A4C1USD3_EUMVA|nr:hypothetical protein EVAR_22755_1 [Eumeta japonica]